MYNDEHGTEMWPITTTFRVSFATQKYVEWGCMDTFACAQLNTFYDDKATAMRDFFYFFCEG